MKDFLPQIPHNPNNPQTPRPDYNLPEPRVDLSITEMNDLALASVRKYLFVMGEIKEAIDNKDYTQEEEEGIIDAICESNNFPKYILQYYNRLEHSPEMIEARRNNPPNAAAKYKKSRGPKK